MKTTLERLPAREAGKSPGEPPIGLIGPNVVRSAATGAAEGQIAEIEHTFSPRYEW
jgi:hypothetical protein